MTQRGQLWMLLIVGLMVVATTAGGAKAGRPFAIAAIVVAVPTMTITAWLLYRGRRASGSSD